ncbi:hypothetical protein ET006_05230 [Lactococcus garvieae]|uniref:Phage protein n=1 Tax=Lactococcus formosensis TaxID=1281486 RepID=A0A9Q8Y0Z0_9LACT|nr:hypothetical protein [Lactococcus formosensis]NHI73513.1 hypothetical protein [Lactococcus garvieae]UKS68400.1 hypothetical protein G8766_04095 [Lactococcus garvieae]USJ19574.1 hypothetical protein LMK00_06975 [Lactococcus formosensis]
MTTKELLDEIIIEIEKLGIELKTADLHGATAYISPASGWGVWDNNRASLFDLCHEYIHAKHGDKVRCFENDCNSPSEKRANKEAILFLWDIFEKSGGASSNIAHFIEITGCPEKLTTIVIFKSKITEWDREEIHTHVDNYLDHSSEEPESWDLYRIMDACRIDYKWEFLVENFIKEYYWNHCQKNKII